jgi:hypothetical protein
MTLDELIEALAGLDAEERLARIEQLVGEVSEDDLATIRDAAIEAAQAYIDEVPSDEASIARAEALTVILDAIDRRTGDAETETEATEAEEADLEATAARAASAEEVAEPAREGELVAADGAPQTQKASNQMPIPLAQAASVAPTQASAADRTDRVKHTVVAAGDLPDYRGGTELPDTKAIAAAVQAGMTVVSRSQAPGVRQGLCSIKREAPDHLNYTGASDWLKVDEVTNQKNLPGKSLVAAGGWCAPSEVLYDVCPIPVSRDGMVDLPTITATRGGVKYSRRPDFAPFWSLVGFEQTETDAIAGVEKPCFEIPCPDDLSECRMDIEGICLVQPLLTERGWPEKVEEFVEYAMLAHAHRINARRIERMVDMATWAITVPGPTRSPADNTLPSTGITVDDHGPGAFESLLSVLELQVEFFRYSMRLSRSALLEGMAPYWLRGLLRADISKKLGIDNRWGIATDEILDRWFADRGVRIQWVYDWQDSMSEQDPAAFGGTPPTAWPDEVSILLWEPGTYFALQQDVINLTGVYDRIDLQRNVYTRLFTEEGFAVCARCGRSMLITIPLCPNGLSGSQELTVCSTTA